MKTKLTLFALFVSATVVFQSNAQSVIVQAGFSLSDVKDSGSGGLVLDSKMKPGFHAGIYTEVPMYKWLSFMPGLMYSNKGAKMDQDILGTDFKMTASMHYLDVPLLMKATGRMEGGTKIFGVLGPYVGIGVGGRGKITTTDDNGNSESSSEKILWGSDPGNLKRMEIGASAGVGMEVKSFLVSVNYDLGLSNISNSSEQPGMEEFNSTSKNRVLRLTLGYRFGGK